MDELDILLSQDQEPSNERLDSEWATLSAVRDMLRIALKGKSTPTYKQALEFGKILAPEIFDSPFSLIGRTEEPPLVREYRQKADAKSQIEGSEINPLELIEKEIEEHRQMLYTPGERQLIGKRLLALEDAKSWFLLKPFTENQLILRDIKADRNMPVPPIERDNYREYRLSEDRGIRIRLLHPDPPEHSIGADLIYEVYWEKAKQARIVVVQYKIWHNKTLYLSQSQNLERQLEKLKKTFCENNLCSSTEGDWRSKAFRLPFCSAFLRPTDKLQRPNDPLASSGLHVPICVVIPAFEDTYAGNKKLQSKRIRSEALSHKVFEEAFNINMLGSRWLSYSEIEALYKEHGILEPNERIVLHA